MVVVLCNYDYLYLDMIKMVMICTVKVRTMYIAMI
jgi:hypothetical protein